MMGVSTTIHPSAIVDAGAQIGEGSRIWHWVHISSGARIGARCSFGQNVYVGNDVTIGDNVKIQNNVSVYDAVTIEDDVFCGPSMVFTNVFNPRSAVPRKDEYRRTLVRRGATLGANTLVVDETVLGTDAQANFSSLFTPSYGADGAGTVGNYTLGINAGATGLVDTASNQAVTLQVVGGVVQGVTAGGALVFTVSVNASGVVTLDQIRAVTHDVDGGPGAAHDDPKTLSAANLITLTATIKGEYKPATDEAAEAMVALTTVDAEKISAIRDQIGRAHV